jgi:hypothetical protein
VAVSFQDEIAHTEALLSRYMSAYHGTPSFNPETIPARRRFLSRRVKLLRNILRWRKHSGERFGIGLMAERLTERCILIAAEGGWEVGGEEIARKVRHLFLTSYHETNLAFSGCWHVTERYCNTCAEKATLSTIMYKLCSNPML